MTGALRFGSCCGGSTSKATTSRFAGVSGAPLARRAPPASQQARAAPGQQAACGRIRARPSGSPTGSARWASQRRRFAAQQARASPSQRRSAPSGPRKGRARCARPRGAAPPPALPPRRPAPPPHRPGGPGRRWWFLRAAPPRASCGPAPPLAGLRAGPVASPQGEPVCEARRAEPLPAQPACCGAPRRTPTPHTRWCAPPDARALAETRIGRAPVAHSPDAAAPP